MTTKEKEVGKSIKTTENFHTKYGYFDHKVFEEFQLEKSEVVVPAWSKIEQYFFVFFNHKGQILVNNFITSINEETKEIGRSLTIPMCFRWKDRYTVSEVTNQLATSRGLKVGNHERIHIANINRNSNEVFSVHYSENAEVSRPDLDYTWIDPNELDWGNLSGLEQFALFLGINEYKRRNA